MDNKQTTNKIVAIGKLKEKKIEFKTSRSGKEMAMGHMVIVCENEKGISENKVKIMQFKYKPDGTENQLYKGVVTIVSSYKDSNTYGEEADYIKVVGDLIDETYYSVRNEEFVERFEIKLRYANRLKVEEVIKQGVTGTIGGYLSNIALKEDGEAEVVIVGLGYEGVAFPIKTLVAKEIVPLFMSKYKVGCNADFNIERLNTVEITKVTQEVGFGEAIEEIIEKRINRTNLIGATVPRYEGITQEQIKQAYLIRETKLDKKKNDTIEYAKGSSNSNTAATGFGLPSNMPAADMGTPNSFANGFGMPQQ